MLSLKTIMRLNATSCIVFGLLFVLLPTQTVAFLSVTAGAPTLAVVSIGAVLIANGLHLLWAAQRPMPNKLLVIYFSLGDFAWVVGSMGLIVFKVWVTTVSGILVTFAVAVLVGGFGLLQLRKVYHLRNNVFNQKIISG